MFAGDAELYQALSSKTLYVQQPSLMELNDRQRAIFRGTWDLILKVCLDIALSFMHTCKIIGR
jgi:hypothetical protein